MSNTLGIIPEAYAKSGLSQLDTYFAMARGHQKGGVDLPATEMKKWFDSNYHYLVPEFSEKSEFKRNDNKPVDDFIEAKEAGYNARPVILGPLTLLWLGKTSKDAQDPNFNRYSLLPKLAQTYVQLFEKLAAAGAPWVQLDEPILVVDTAKQLSNEFKQTYELFHKSVPNLNILVATYFGRLEDNIDFVKELPIAGLHIDLDRAPEQLEPVLSAIAPTKIGLSLGLVSCLLYTSPSPRD